MTFDAAYKIYGGYQVFSHQLTAGKVEFCNHLLHPVHGLRIYILFKPAVKHFICLRPDLLANIEPVLTWLLNSESYRGSGATLRPRIGRGAFQLNASNTQEVLNCMDTEWDRNNRTNEEIESLGN